MAQCNNIRLNLGRVQDKPKKGRQDQNIECLKDQRTSNYGHGKKTCTGTGLGRLPHQSHHHETWHRVLRAGMLAFN